MAAKPESRLQQKIQRALRARGIMVFKVHGSPYSAEGIADLIGCIEGKFFAIEVKMPGKESTLTINQEIFLKKSRKAGGLAGVATDVEEALEILGLEE